jgi:hypothetical protein
MTDIERLDGALKDIDIATTAAADAVVAIGTRIQNLMTQIGTTTNPAAITQAADDAGKEAAKLQGVAAALKAMGTNPATPVPIAVPAV